MFAPLVPPWFGGTSLQASRCPYWSRSARLPLAPWLRLARLLRLLLVAGLVRLGVGMDQLEDEVENLHPQLTIFWRERIARRWQVLEQRVNQRIELVALGAIIG